MSLKSEIRRIRDLGDRSIQLKKLIKKVADDLTEASLPMNAWMSISRNANS